MPHPRAIVMEKNEYAVMYALETDYWWYRGLHELVEKYIRFFSKKNAPPSILDAGCGTGRMMELAGRFGSVEGFDFSQDAMHFSAMRGLDSISCQDLNTWTSAGEKYDIVISLDVLCHRSIRDEADVIRKFFYALRQNGVLILNLPAFELLRRNHDAAVHTRKRYTKKPTIKMLEKEGFRVIRASYRLPHFFIIMFAKKILERFFPSPTITSDLALLPVWLNNMLLFFNRIENAIVFSGITMPAGGSLFIVAQKNGQG
jgi:2-polyprenyl-3-methyl-5-hydroxy-6-metoxy-1,4-benzoquinol methylase